ncbi:putative serine protein kinase [Canariomyces notabilis]|uniref:non-specific serine/threonine protein kinase n=1 Tax=Canariomyces notabilis TaxID=2074819 RepID=A0AAN6QED0_9PEZI|nr:putative serine protein kinase [Canariomyces arenarius]
MGSSPPSTPPSRAPKDDERRLKDITSPCEWVEDYHPGGYHPVHLGDVFNDGQYKVIRKLGEGSYSTVWLARDLKHNIYVALKILVSELSEPTRELEILRYLANTQPAEGGRYITQLLGEFKHHGPNGLHMCLVFEPMGPSVNSMVYELPQFKPRKIWMNALAFLHENGISHGDFQPGNMLFALDDINSKPEDELRQDMQGESISPPVQRLDGKDDPWAPRYLCVAQPLASYTPYADGFKIKLSDMGGAYFFADPPSKIITPRGLRTPESVLTGTINKTLDVWSFGCLVFELITGLPLFCIPGTGFEDDEHLLQLTARGVPEGKEPLMVQENSMEESFDEAAPELDEEEACRVKALIRRILQYDPAKRPLPAEILRDPWFCEEGTPQLLRMRI